MDNFEAMETQDYTYDDVEVTETQEQQASYEAPTYVETTPVQPAPQPVYAPYSNPIPATYSEPATEEKDGLDGKSVVIGVVGTALVGGIAIGVKKGVDYFKKKKAEKAEFKKWQEERKVAEDTIAKAKAEGRVVDVDATEVKPETEEAKQEPATESKSEETKDSKQETKKK